jgi:chitin disaccharide deacetylase
MKSKKATKSFKVHTGTVKVVMTHPVQPVKRAGVLIINADDWGRNCETTERILDCVSSKTVSSVSAMVYMEDSERAANMACERNIDAGLHLNLSQQFTVPGSATRVADHQQRICRYLRQHRWAKAIFQPWLANSFEYVVKAQFEEFLRIYGREPERVDGHHHMHLCANVLMGKLLPAGVIVRRNFSFRPGEKSWGNRFYRQMIDNRLARRHLMTDFFYSLPPLDSTARLQFIFEKSRQFAVELETHPINPVEYKFLAEGEIFKRFGEVPIASSYHLAN